LNQDLVPYAPNRAQRRAAGKTKVRPVYRGRPMLGPPICFRETYDGTPFLAAELGKESVGQHHVRNAFKRLRRQERAA
jgi:hypothetical protein